MSAGIGRSAAVRQLSTTPDTSGKVVATFNL